MKNLKIYVIELILFISIIVFNYIYNSTTFLYGSIILLTVVSLYLFGFYRDNSYIKGNVIRIVLSCLLSFFIVIYCIGLFTGFNRTIFSFTSDYIVKIILLEAVIIICEELLRYIIAKKSNKSIIPIIIYTIIMSLLNIIIEINGFDLVDSESIFIFISVVIIPVISREFLCSYLTYKVSFIPSLIYKLVIVLYEYIVPIIPSLGNYLYSVTNVLLVYIIYILSSKSIIKNQRDDKFVRRASYSVIYIPVIILLSFIVILVSGIFRYKLIAIGSSSMHPIYDRGDAIIYDKKYDDLEVGDIIAFEKSNVIITHRIVRINKNTGYIKTKGDNNNAADFFDITTSEVLGKVEYKVKYIGYPTIWINEIFGKGEFSDDE